MIAFTERELILAHRRVNQTNDDDLRTILTPQIRERMKRNALSILNAHDSHLNPTTLAAYLSEALVTGVMLARLEHEAEAEIQGMLG